MGAGHATGFGRSLLEEDAAVQTSMGPIVDRSQEHLSSSDVAVAHARRMLLDAAPRRRDRCVAARERAGSAESVRLPNCLDVMLAEGQRWEDAALDQLPT